MRRNVSTRPEILRQTRNKSTDTGGRGMELVGRVQDHVPRKEVICVT